jgi:hypothetical protein
MPAVNKRSISFGERLAGPMVHTILECRKLMNPLAVLNVDCFYSLREPWEIAAAIFLCFRFASLLR